MTQELQVYDPTSAHALALFSNPDSLDFVRTAFTEVGIRQSNLTKVKVPSGGMGAFAIEGLNGDTFEPTLDVVVAFAQANQRAWYSQAFEDSGGGTAPDCASHDGVTGFGQRTHETAAQAQEAYDTDERMPLSFGDCTGCPWDEWESAAGPSKGKACAEQTNLYFFAGKQLLPMMMVIPPTSVRVFRDYAINLMKYGLVASQVVTRISLEVETNPSGVDYSKLVLTCVSAVPDDRMADCSAMSALLRETFTQRNPEPVVEAEVTEAETTDN